MLAPLQESCAGFPLRSRGGVASNVENRRAPCCTTAPSSTPAELQQQIHAGLPLLLLLWLSVDQHLYISSSPNGPAIYGALPI
eukprot:1160009-Pelagomonas_calceolata.AAC.4